MHDENEGLLTRRGAGCNDEEQPRDGEMEELRSRFAVVASPSDPLASPMSVQTYASTRTLAATLPAPSPARLLVSHPSGRPIPHRGAAIQVRPTRHRICDADARLISGSGCLQPGLI